MATIDLGKIQPLWRGEFSPTPATNYEPLDNLSYLDTVYICILEADGTQLPTNATYFRPLIDLTTYKLQSVIAFVVSQYAGGDATNVAPISAGLPIAAYDWFIDTNTLQVFSKNGATGTFSDPLDFDPATGVDSGLSSALKNISIGASQFAIGTTPQLAALTLPGGTFTDGTSNYRTAGATYTNNETYPIQIMVESQSSDIIMSLEVNGLIISRAATSSNAVDGRVGWIIDPGLTYRVNMVSGSIEKWVEGRR